MFQTPKSVKEILQDINKLYFLPAIQREFVWKEDQIISLFDSLMKGFPIGSFLFWEVNNENLQKFEFYNFIEEYSELDNYHNQISEDVKRKDHIVSILDGQQRITSLLIGIKGSYTTKKYRSSGKKILYISLSSTYNMEEVDDIESMYKFKFMSKDEADSNNNEMWFRVGDILDMNLGDITKFSIENQLNSLGIDILTKLYDTVNSRIINYFLETSDEIDKVLNIFVRINSGGTHLSYSDLLLSVATANWNNVNAREEINDLMEEINRISDGFNISKDFILKTSLYILGKDMKFKVANFTNDTMKEIEQNWEKIKNSIKESFVFLAQNGFYSKNLISSYPASVISYFIFNFGIDYIEKNKNELIKFIRVSLLKGIFSSSLDSVLSSIRKTSKDMKSFKIKHIDESLPLNKKLNFSNNEIKDLLAIKDTQKSFLLILSILYERKEGYTSNTILNKKEFVKEDEELQKMSRTIVNYQLVDLKQSDKPFFEQDDFKYRLKENYFLEEITTNSRIDMIKSRQKNLEQKLKEDLKI